MTGALLITIAFLLWLCASLVILLIGRDRAANREEARLDRIADDLAMELTKEQAKVRHLQERNQDLRDELDTTTGSVEPSLVAEMTAFLADAKPEDFQ